MRIFSQRLLLPTILLGLVSGLATSFANPQSITRKQAEDRVIGRWTLDLAKSRFAGGSAPKSQTRIYEADPMGVKATITTIHADGHATTVRYVAGYDSVEYPLTGSPEYDAISLKRVDEATAEARLIHAGKEIATARRVISEDGRTMTITVKTNISGAEVTNTAVFQRQPTSYDE
jgi:hypothetical protein